MSTYRPGDRVTIHRITGSDRRRRLYAPVIGMTGTILPAEVRPDSTRVVIRLDGEVTLGGGEYGPPWEADEIITYEGDLTAITEDQA